mmetsp:Transcript_7047/g.11783  ORF Transcript_7047/g.11783 Transcript_7047/m.11783 type:complete len:709 (-) Transcript_7047:5351-7477(-)
MKSHAIMTEEVDPGDLDFTNGVDIYEDDEESNLGDEDTLQKAHIEINIPEGDSIVMTGVPESTIVQEEVYLVNEEQRRDDSDRHDVSEKHCSITENVDAEIEEGIGSECKELMDFSDENDDQDEQGKEYDPPKRPHTSEGALRHSSPYGTDKPVPSFLRPTKSFSAPKMIDVKEEFPDSPATKRGIMMKITPNTTVNTFDSIFLYDDKVKEPKEEDQYDMRYKDRKNVRSLYRPTLCSIALPVARADANAITKRGTMVRTKEQKFISKFEKLVEEAQQMDLDNLKKSKKPSIPKEAFEHAVSPANKGHTFDKTLPPKKEPVPAELFSECIKSPLKDRILKVAEMEREEKVPRVMKEAVPFSEFSPTPVSQPPVVDDNKPIKSIKQLHIFIKNKVVIAEMMCKWMKAEWERIIECELKDEIEAVKAGWSHQISSMSRISTATPQRRLYDRTLQQSISASHMSSFMGSMATDNDIQRSKKMMESSVALELHRSRNGMNRAKVACAKEVESLKAYAREAAEVVCKLCNRYMTTTKSAGQRSGESFLQYTTCLQNYNKLVPSVKKDNHQKRLHLIANQQTTVMCSGLQSIEDVISNLEEIKTLLEKERLVGDYCFQEANLVHFFPENLQKFFANPIVSPSKMKLMVKRLPKKKKKRSKKKMKRAEITSSSNNQAESDDNNLFEVSDNDDDDANPDREVLVEDSVFLEESESS